MARLNRSSRQEVFCKKGVVRNFAKFTGKHLCQSFNKVAGWPATVLKKRLTQVFSCEFCKLSKNTFSYRTCPVAASYLTWRKPFSNQKIIYHTNDHLWCLNFLEIPQRTVSRNWKNSAFEKGDGSASRSKQKVNNVFFNELWVFDIFVLRLAIIMQYLKDSV